MNYIKQLNKILCITSYKGCSIMQKNDGFYVFNQRHDTLQQARETIDNSFKIIKDRIR